MREGTKVFVERRQQITEVVDLEQCRNMLYRPPVGPKQPRKLNRSKVKHLVIEQLFVDTMDNPMFEHYIQLRHLTKVAIWNKFVRTIAIQGTTDLYSSLSKIVYSYTK